ncbi:hypothetical protein BHYA_0045g00340 [Botrytis hyacinthi]|uniref:Uncharacterized protein n=1 Tax=Botrytis hyacinthi TaxID=278943 RepID=A0A4Z1GXZ8_9HELO|nr:hypothetical protein BHYA_0045g00340 [Botrytis hyacinthi]
MQTKNILALFALTASVLSAPVPSSKLSSLGSAFGNLNWNGEGNSVGNGNKGNGNDNGDGSGSNDGNGNVFGNGNAIGSGNSGIDILKRGYGSNVLGSAFGNLNSNGEDNTAGNGNAHNGNGNGVESGSWDGNGNKFGNGNTIGSDNSGMSILNRGSGPNVLGSALSNLNGNGNGNSAQTDFNSAGNENWGNGNGNGDDSGSSDGNGNIFGYKNSIGSGNSGSSILNKVRKSKTPTLSSHVNGVWVAAIDPITNSLSSSGDAANAVGTATDTLGGNSGSNTAGSSNSGNGNGNGNGSGSNNGNTFGNGNQILSNNGGVNVRRQSDAADVIPDQTATGVNKDVTELFKSFLPTGVPGIVKGAATGTESNFGKGQNEKRQLVLTGVGDVIAQDVAAYIP